MHYNEIMFKSYCPKRYVIVKLCAYEKEMKGHYSRDCWSNNKSY